MVPKEQQVMHNTIAPADTGDRRAGSGDGIIPAERALTAVAVVVEAHIDIGQVQQSEPVVACAMFAVGEKQKPEVLAPDSIAYNH